MYNECDKHQRVYTQGLLIPQLQNTTAHICSPLRPLVVCQCHNTSPNSSHYPWQHANIPVPSNDLAQCQIPTVPLAIYQLESHNIHVLGCCPNSHNKFMAYFKTACLPQIHISAFRNTGPSDYRTFLFGLQGLLFLTYTYEPSSLRTFELQGGTAKIIKINVAPAQSSRITSIIRVGKIVKK